MKKEVYPFELKLEIVQKYLQGSIGVQRLTKGAKRLCYLIHTYLFCVFYRW